MFTQPQSVLSPTFVYDVQTALLRWYEAHARPLPWRTTSDPYAIWVSEVMLQQTQVKTVIPYYNRFMQQLPTLSALAEAGERDLARVWAGLGYYQRVRNLQAAARQVLEQYNGKIPDDWQAFRSLPGVGDYTAGAVLSIAFQKPYVAVDGNVKRVLARFFAIGEPIERATTLARITQHAQVLLPHHVPGMFNQALMELGAMVCTPRMPQCTACPINFWCKACQLGNATELPVRHVRKKQQAVFRVSGVICKGDKLLFQRRTQGVLQGYWDLPSLALQQGEHMESGAERLVRQLAQWGFVVRPGQYLGAIAHTFSHQHWEVHLYTLNYTSSTMDKVDYTLRVRESATEYVSGQEKTTWAWLTPHEVRETGLPVALRKILDKAEPVTTR